ncbi:transcriptional regulator [Acinetobacter guillouiae]|uniref:transcriptional regulator n=1 Tax=Acinetobacter guillouiae TaxID=106649 RepID=UPI003AF838BF
MVIYPVRIKFQTACQILDVSRETLNNIIKLDPDFPPKIKVGNSRQSPVYFDYMQIIEWHKSKMQNLTQNSNEVDA